MFRTYSSAFQFYGVYTCVYIHIYMYICMYVYPCNKNQQDALFIFNLFQQLTSACFEQAYCSSSGGTTVYIQQLLYVMLKILELFKIT
jgi:hypothetical protein